MTRLDDENKVHFKNLRNGEVLRDVEGHRLDGRIGVVTCGDGHQICDILEHQAAVCGEFCEDPVIHVLALNGGALLIPEDSPLNTDFPAKDLMLLEEMRVACEVKNLGVIALYTHYPCAMARREALSLPKQLDLLARAKRRVKKEMPAIKVACFCHVDHCELSGEQKRRTYYFDEEQFNSWLEHSA